MIFRYFFIREALIKLLSHTVEKLNVDLMIKKAVYLENISFLDDAVL